MITTNSVLSYVRSNANRLTHSMVRFIHNPNAGFISLLAIALTFLTHLTAYAQDGNAGITEATMRIRSYFATGTSLMYAIGSVVGLVGAIKVFQKWNSGDQDTGKVAAAWFGSCVFLVIVATVLRSFFGI